MGTEPRAVAPTWHTVVLVVVMLAITIHSAWRFAGTEGDVNRLATYGFTAAMEVALVAWVLFGLRLSRTPVASLLGEFSFSPRAVAKDAGIALAFWMVSLLVLGSVGIAYSGVDALVHHRSLIDPAAAHAAAQNSAAHAMARLAPANGQEIAAWALLCILVGFAEEFVFRGYLQRQFTAWARGAAGVGVVCSALLFGGAHAYQGARSMVQLAVFGLLFSVLALYRRSLRAGMIAHGWNDLIAGLLLALLNAHHLI